MKKIIIALDGPAGSGKTTTAKIVADKLGYLYIDTGAMYRAVTLAWFRQAREYDEARIVNMLDNLNIELRQSDLGQRTILNGEDVSEAIRLPEVTKLVSPVSAIAHVREKLVAIQREIGKDGGVVMDGRDIGTAVFPHAELKVYLIASISARASRRTRELLEKGIPADVEVIQQEIMDRDHYDSNRAHSPLCKAEDAIEIDTSNMTLQEQADKILALANIIINQ